MLLYIQQKSSINESMDKHCTIIDRDLVKSSDKFAFEIKVLARLTISFNLLDIQIIYYKNLMLLKYSYISKDNF